MVRGDSANSNPSLDAIPLDLNPESENFDPFERWIRLADDLLRKSLDDKPPADRTL
jgi:hypothetical protein